MRKLNSFLVGLLGVVLLLTLAAASHRGWHQSIHHDAASDTHSCLITLFSHAQVDLADDQVAPSPLILQLLAESTLSPAALFSEADFLSPPGRAPPLHA